MFHVAMFHVFRVFLFQLGLKAAAQQKSKEAPRWQHVATPKVPIYSRPSTRMLFQSEPLSLRTCDKYQPNLQHDRNLLNSEKYRPK